MEEQTSKRQDASVAMTVKTPPVDTSETQSERNTPRNQNPSSTTLRERWLDVKFTNATESAESSSDPSLLYDDESKSVKKYSDRGEEGNTRNLDEDVEMIRELKDIADVEVDEKMVSKLTTKMLRDMQGGSSGGKSESGIITADRICQGKS